MQIGRLLAVLLAAVMALTLAACGNSNNNRFFSLGMSGNVVEIRLECL